MKHLKTVQLQQISKLTQLATLIPTRNDVVEIGGAGGGQKAVLLYEETNKMAQWQTLQLR